MNTFGIYGRKVRLYCTRVSMFFKLAGLLIVMLLVVSVDITNKLQNPNFGSFLSLFESLNKQLTCVVMCCLQAATFEC